MTAEMVIKYFYVRHPWSIVDIPAPQSERLCPVLVDIQPAQWKLGTAITWLVIEEICDHLDHIVVGRLPPCLADLLVYEIRAMRDMCSLLAVAT